MSEESKRGVDEVGLPVTTSNRKLYAKRSCNKGCNGTGAIRWLYVKGQKLDKDKQEQDCACVTKKYTKLRREIDSRLEAALKDVPKDGLEAARGMALPTILEDLGFGG